jgi:hypothetical protein
MSETVYLVTFDKPGRSLSGWHYSKLREIGAERIQKSVLKMRDIDHAKDAVKLLRESGVREIRIFKAVDVTTA